MNELMELQKKVERELRNLMFDSNGYCRYLKKDVPSNVRGQERALLTVLDMIEGQMEKYYEAEDEG